MGKKVQKVATANTVKKLSQNKKNELNKYLDSIIQIGLSSNLYQNNPAEQWTCHTTMQTVLERIRLIEADLKVKSMQKNREAAIEKFVAWVNPAKFDGVKIAEFVGYDLGLEATKDFKKGDLLMVIPKKLIFSFDQPDFAPVLESIPNIQSMSSMGLAIILLFEKLKPNSFWKPYLDILPEKYTTCLYFTVDEMKELKNSSALLAALKQCKIIARQYVYLAKHIQEKLAAGDESEFISVMKDRFTYDLYCWAVSTVMTRQNLVPTTVSGLVEDLPALIPFWDMANHKDDVVTTGYNEELQQIESAALTDYKKGEQIFIHYGNRNNVDLMIHNGFIYPDNKHDSLPIRLSLSTADELYEERTQLLAKLSVPPTGELLLLKAPKCISDQLLGFIRVFNMDKDQLAHWLKNERATDLLHIDCALECKLETKTWLFLQTRLQLLLKVFPTTLAEDVELIIKSASGGANKLGRIRQMLINFRIIEKTILSDALEFAKSRVKA